MEQQKQKTLKFIHITKNAGSSIENRGRHCYWGKYHKEYSKHGHHTLFNKIPLDIRQKYDWFLVVRNPYSRVVSEMNCKFASNWNNRLKHHSKEQLNELVMRNLIRGNEMSEIELRRFKKKQKEYSTNYNKLETENISTSNPNIWK